GAEDSANRRGHRRRRGVHLQAFGGHRYHRASTGRLEVHWEEVEGSDRRVTLIGSKAHVKEIRV
ncbi:unnamed protein product, partial [Phaeothamnion confervicola]